MLDVHELPSPQPQSIPTDMANMELPFDVPRSPAVSAAVLTLAAQGGIEERGAVFTKGGVVDAILELSGYTIERPLHELRLLEPSFGDGDFLFAAVELLVESYLASGGLISDAVTALSPAIRGVELHTATYDATCARLLDVLGGHGMTEDDAAELVDVWLMNDDFLLADMDGRFDFVVGNPPYVRQERIPAPLLKTYKSIFETLYDRADLYVLFYERGLDLLVDGGVLGFICANRWIKNKYGGPLRQKVTSSFHLKYFIDLERADAFHSEVSAYPAITVIGATREGGATLVSLGHRDCASKLSSSVAHLRRAAERDGAPDKSVAVVKKPGSGRDPWLLDAPLVLSCLRDMEARLPTMEEDGAKVGIGVATGADRVFIGEYESLPVEPERKLRLAMAADCTLGPVAWSGKGVVNPYLESGQLAPLADFPQFAAYMNEHAETLKKRHTARRQPQKWYRTIDRVYPALAREPKLLIPDIKGEATVAYDDGTLYPHHNLYVITSDKWDLRALQAVLRSSVSLAFVAAYCVRMSGGFLRFQAQYLRRIRVPSWSSLSDASKGELVAVAAHPDVAVVDSVVLPLYGLKDEAREAICEFADDARVSGSKHGRTSTSPELR
jgi:hypothetical protein